MRIKINCIFLINNSFLVKNILIFFSKTQLWIKPFDFSKKLIFFKKTVLLKKYIEIFYLFF